MGFRWCSMHRVRSDPTRGKCAVARCRGQKVHCPILGTTSGRTVMGANERHLERRGLYPHWQSTRIPLGLSHNIGDCQVPRLIRKCSTAAFASCCSQCFHPSLQRTKKVRKRLSSRAKLTDRDSSTHTDQGRRRGVGPGLGSGQRGGVASCRYRQGAGRRKSKGSRCWTPWGAPPGGNPARQPSVSPHCSLAPRLDVPFGTRAREQQSGKAAARVLLHLQVW